MLLFLVNILLIWQQFKRRKTYNMTVLMKLSTKQMLPIHPPKYNKFCIVLRLKYEVYGSKSG